MRVTTLLHSKIIFECSETFSENVTLNLRSEPFSEKVYFVDDFLNKNVNIQKNRGEIPCRGAYKLNSNHFLRPNGEVYVFWDF